MDKEYLHCKWFNHVFYRKTNQLEGARKEIFKAPSFISQVYFLQL